MREIARLVGIDSANQLGAGVTVADAAGVAQRLGTQQELLHESQTHAH